MPRCESCGFGHAQANRCVNCGSTDPFPRRRLIKLVLWLLALIAFVASGFYFYERASYLQRAEERAKAVGDGSSPITIQRSENAMPAGVDVSGGELP